MTTLNAYANLAEFKAYITSRGGSISEDTTDDGVMESLLVWASRYLDTQTGRQFYPYIETRYFDVPEDRTLFVDFDLLEVLSITNGDGTSVPSTEYSLRPRNSTPHYGIRLIDNSSYVWSSDGAGDTHDVIAVSGVWGFHDKYAQAWKTITTANEAMDTSETGYDVTSAVGFAVGDLIRFDDELGYVSSIASASSLTTTRGENGSTAATHLTSINVKAWRVMDDAKIACLELANTAYRRRYGQSTSASETVTAAGVVLSPKEVPAVVRDFIRVYRRIV